MKTSNRKKNMRRDFFRNQDGRPPNYFNREAYSAIYEAAKKDPRSQVFDPSAK